MRYAARTKGRGRCGAGRAGPGRVAPARAFTLVELMVVVSIIGLLVGILVPVVTEAIKAAEVQRTKAWMITLATGCTSFKTSTKHYPGQEDFAQLRGSSGPYTGSQVLGAQLFGYDNLADISNTTKPPPMDGSHAPVKAGDLDKFYIGGQWRAKHTPPPGYPCTVLDRAGNPTAVLYYPYRVNENPANAVDGFKYNDNVVYIEANAMFNDYVAETGKGASYTPAQYHTDMINHFRGSAVAQSGADPSSARNQGAFVLVAAGRDRVYFTSDDIVWP